MKTLDEVIGKYKQSLLTSIHIVITATNMDDEYSVGLRNGLRICKAYIDGQEPEYEEVQNNPLTWDELKGMEGKPVWVETKYYSPRWAVITNANYNRVYFVGKQLLDSEGREDLGKIWQAYRKERK